MTRINHTLDTEFHFGVVFDANRELTKISSMQTLGSKSVAGVPILTIAYTLRFFAKKSASSKLKKMQRPQ